MISRIYKKLKTEWLKNKLKDEQAFFKLFSEKEFVKHYSNNKEKLSPSYNFYVQNISRADMAVSLQLAAMVLSLAELKKVARVVDLGSGYSSYVLRHYASQHKLEVWSIDDDENWLQKTIDYLRQSKLNTDRVQSMSQFKASKEADFDIVLLDLNFVEVRKLYISLAVDRCAKGGIIIFDDVHKPEYLQELLFQAQRLPIKLYEMKRFSLDQYKRYALVGVKQ